MVKLDEIKLLDLVPSGLRSDKDVIEACGAIQPEIDLLASSIDSVKLLSTIDTQENEQVLDHLAWQFGLSGVEGWALASTLGQKRAMVKKSLVLHMTKGTPHAVSSALEGIGVDTKIIEWFDFGGDPGTFKVKVVDNSDRGVDTSKMDQILAVIDAFKPVKAHYTIDFLLGRTAAVPMIGSAVKLIERIEVFPEIYTFRAGTNHAGERLGSVIFD